MNKSSEVDLQEYQKDGQFDPNFVNSTSIRDSLENDHISKNIYVYFNGNCSQCIISFLDFVSQLQQIKFQDNTHWFYIGDMNNNYQISYYLENSGISLSKNEHLIADSDQKFIYQNSFIDPGALTIVLTNKADSVLIMGNPFEIEKVMNEYIEQEIVR